jgi:hypothetical protein
VLLITLYMKSSARLNASFGSWFTSCKRVWTQ